jgi:hypothetical protein
MPAGNGGLFHGRSLMQKPDAGKLPANDQTVPACQQNDTLPSTLAWKSHPRSI